MQEIQKLRTFFKLKSVYRFCSVGSRKESSAEHSWSCLMLADYFLNLMTNSNINRLKVYELLMYHDVVEIEAGDTPLHPEMSRVGKEEKERKAIEFLKNEIPKNQSNKLTELFNEFEEQKTTEAKFAKAIDQIEAELHEMDYKKDWKGWTKEFLVNKKLKYFEEFPEIKKVFEKSLKYIEENGYFDQ